MHNSHVIIEDRCPNTLSAALNLIVNFKGWKRHPAQKYESRKVMALTTRGNIVGFR